MFTLEASRRFPKVAVDAFSPGLIPDPKGFFKYQNPLFARTFDKVAALAGVRGPLLPLKPFPHRLW